MKLRRSLLSGLAGSILFAILLGSSEFTELSLGFAVGFSSMLLFGRILQNDTLGTNTITLLRYFAVLFFRIFRSTFDVIRCILTDNNPNVQIASVLANQEISEGSHLLVANSITLTPGTVTLDENPSEYTILSLLPDYKEQALEYEKALCRKEKRLK